MELDVTKMQADGFRSMSVSGALRNFLDKIPVGGKMEISSVVDAKGEKKNPCYVRPFMLQVSKPGEKFTTRNINGSLHVWRLS